MFESGHHGCPFQLAIIRRFQLRRWHVANRLQHQIRPQGTRVRIEVAAQLGELTPEDVRLECLIGREDEHQEFVTSEYFGFTAEWRLDTGETRFVLDLGPPLPGLQHFQTRIYPCHPLLSHRFETGCMVWL